MGSQLSLYCIGKDRLSLMRFDERHESAAPPDGVIIDGGVNWGGLPLAILGNRFLDIDLEYEVFGLCHADVTFDLQDLIVFRDTAAAGRVCGMVGRDLIGNYVWSKHLNSDYSVSTLDCCSVFFRRDSGLRFDEETFDGFHCYVEDLCLQAHAKGIPVVVPPAKASHLEESTRNPEWQADYKIYRKRLAIKWAGTVFETT